MTNAIDSPRNDDPFVEYYVHESVSSRTLERSVGVMNAVLRVRASRGLRVDALTVADVGCNTGTQALMWAERGHEVYGLDINEKLLKVAAERSEESGHKVAFSLGTATKLPWEAESMDVCLLPELLEHVEDWESCVAEAHRVLRRGGTLFLSTTNALCPVQHEFDVPLYSWFPKPLKTHYEHLAVNSRPELVNHAKFPAVHWFTPYSLGRHLNERGFETFDRFDSVDLAGKSALQRQVLRTIRLLPPLRFLAHVATPYTMLIAEKLE